MKALILTEPKVFSYTDVVKPSISEDLNVLVRVKAVAICGSDVHGMDGSTGRRRPPIIMGHEASGVIEEIGKNVRSFKVGDRVTFDSTIYCGDCFFCRRGEPNLCDNRHVLGVSCAEYKQDGAFAEYVVVPERILYTLPEKVDFVSAAMTEPLAVAAHALRMAALRAGETVVVVGAGLIGLLLIQVLRANNSGKIIAVDLDATRLKAAKHYGADETLLSDAGTVEKIRQLTEGRGADASFEVVGANAPLAIAIESLRKGGSLTLVGNLSPKVDLALQAIVTRQLRLQGSCAIAGEYQFALDLMASGKVDVKSLISACAPLAEGSSWFQRLYEREAGLLKVVLEP
ncbi:galactitol-1-phosphate 5-dehydrogenase [Treponema sp.]